MQKTNKFLTIFFGHEVPMKTRLILAFLSIVLLPLIITASLTVWHFRNITIQTYSDFLIVKLETLNQVLGEKKFSTGKRSTEKRRNHTYKQE